ncbi:exopolysaccharide biosynthesis polyprenyl glycosylphosphotransferase [soil metagenome]
MVHLENRERKPAEKVSYSGVVPQAGRPGVLTHREGKWMLKAGDLIALVTPAVLATLIRHSERPIALSLSEIATILFSAIFWGLMSMAADLYSLGRASSFAKTHRATIVAAILVLGTRPLYAPHIGSGSQFIEMRYAIYAVLGVAFWRSLFAYGAKLVPFTKRIVAIGAGVSGSLIAEELFARNKRGEKDYQLVGFVDDDPTKANTIHEGYPVMGPSTSLLELIKLHSVDTLCLCVNSSKVDPSTFQALVHARERGVRIVSMPVLYEDLTERIAVEHTGDNWGVVFPVEHQKTPAMHDVLARSFDIVCSLFGIVLVAVVSPIIMIVNQFGNKGPLLYSQIRVGKGGRDFRIYKYRSMVTNAEAAGAQWAQENDPRITKIGNFMRKTRIDELPQFWNVLKGEMSVIGPRPERPEFVNLLEDSIPFFRARNAVKPGLTGWAQVKYRYGASEEDSLVKLQYDLYYIKHRSPAIDIRIVAKSVKVILTGAGR